MNREAKVVCLLAFTLILNVSGEPVCDGNPASSALETKLTEGVSRLMELRHPHWGWTNTPQTVLGLQLGKPSSLFGLNETLDQMESEIRSESGSMSLGKVALYVLAIKSGCEDPHNFRGIDVVEQLRVKLSREFHVGGILRSQPESHWYHIGLAVQAMCIAGGHIDSLTLVEFIRRQTNDGSFGNHSVDSTSVAMLGLSCLHAQNLASSTPTLDIKITRAIENGVSYLNQSITTDRNNVWIGNQYSTPLAMLALREATRGTTPASSWFCSHVVNSLLRGSLDTERAAYISHLLPALSGRSILSLAGNITCPTPVLIPNGYQPTHSTVLEPNCADFEMGNIFMEFFTTRIRVQLSVIKPDSTDAITVHGVKKDNYLLQIMQQARCNQELEFETTSTSWGESVTSINGLRAESSKREYWALLDGTTGNFLPLGVSSYQPSDGQHIVFELRKW